MIHNQADFETFFALDPALNREKSQPETGNPQKQADRTLGFEAFSETKQNHSQPKSVKDDIWLIMQTTALRKEA